MQNTFLDVPSQYGEYGGARYAVLPVPYDGTSTWIKGADRGPEALLEASRHLELYDLETDSEPYRAGIAVVNRDINFDTPDTMVDGVDKAVSGILDDGKFPIVIGGEHSVSIGAVAAVRRRYPGLSVLQLDAHADLRDSFNGSRFNHACVMRRISERCPIVQWGIRAVDREETALFKKGRIFHPDRIKTDPKSAGRIVRILSGPVYITVDLDVFDPAFMPSTGTPEPGGMDWYEVTGLLKKVFTGRMVVGFDLVELAPRTSHAAEFLAAKLLYTMIAYHQHARRNSPAGPSI